MKRHTGKVFCIGWHKTGTTSIGRALAILGYRVVGWSGRTSIDLIARWHEGNHAALVEEVARSGADAFEDLPWPLVFAELDRAFPDAKFILTVRQDEATWLRSFQQHFATIRKFHLFLIYGSYDAVGDAELFAARYRQHNAAVRKHFVGRPGKLLDLAFERGDGWFPLCRFLGIDQMPDVPFPHANRATDRFAHLQSASTNAPLGNRRGRA